MVILFVVLVAVVATTAMLLVRRRAPEGSYFEDGDRAAGVFGVIATGLAVLIASEETYPGADYSTEEIEFLLAMERYQREAGRIDERVHASYRRSSASSRAPTSSTYTGRTRPRCSRISRAGIRGGSSSRIPWRPARPSSGS